MVHVFTGTTHDFLTARFSFRFWDRIHDFGFFPAMKQLPLDLPFLLVGFTFLTAFAFLTNHLLSLHQ